MSCEGLRRLIDPLAAAASFGPRADFGCVIPSLHTLFDMLVPRLLLTAQRFGQISLTFLTAVDDLAGLPDSSTSRVPPRLCDGYRRIRVLMSFAASALRCAACALSTHAKAAPLFSRTGRLPRQRFEGQQIGLEGMPSMTLVNIGESSCLLWLISAMRLRPSDHCTPLPLGRALAQLIWPGVH